MNRRAAALIALLCGLLMITSCLPFGGPDPTPNPDPTPGAVLFFDDFEDGLDPAWQTSSGWMEVDEGWLYCGDALHTGRVYAYVLDGTHWSDYAVEVDVDPRGTMAIILRCSEDLQDYVTMEATLNAVTWRVFEDREEIKASESISPGLFEGVNRVRVEAQGTQYRVYIEDLLRSQFTYSGRSVGMPGLAADPGYWNAPGPGFDYFQVKELP